MTLKSLTLTLWLEPERAPAPARDAALKQMGVA